MALLIVQAASEDTIAAPGNRKPNYVCASVTDAVGNPVTGLGVANFAVQPLVVGPGGALDTIQSVTAAGLPGMYIVSVVPIGTETWKSGTYIFGLSVTHAGDHGQALATVLMD